MYCDCKAFLVFTIVTTSISWILHLMHISKHTSVYITHKIVDRLPAKILLGKPFFVKTSLQLEAMWTSAD